MLNDDYLNDCSKLVLTPIKSIINYIGRKHLILNEFICHLKWRCHHINEHTIRPLFSYYYIFFDYFANKSQFYCWPYFTAIVKEAQ